MTIKEALKSVLTPDILKRMDKELCASINAAIPHTINLLTVSEWAEQNRILSASVTSRPGPFRFDVVPYMREICDCLSENSPIYWVTLMKGAQVSYTTAVLENMIGYIIAAAPGPAMFVSADKGVAEASIELRVDAMIESAGLADKIFPQVQKKHGKKGGDTKARKDFPGGYLMALGPRVGSKLRSFPIRYLLCDELDGWPLEIGGSESGKTAAEGDPLSLAEKRTVSFERTRKILVGSTPLVKQFSKTERLFLDGDQRYYYVRCKDCGHMQRLRWRDDEGVYRLKYELDEMGRLIEESVHYECEKCGAHWKNDDKAWFLPRGEWRPTVTSKNPRMRSYHLSALYAGIGFRSWNDIVREWIAIGDDVTRLRTFINTTLGESFEEKGWAPRPERVHARAEAYHLNELPDDVRPLLLTVGADVQDDRIECEVVAWGRDAESWSIDYRRFPETGKGNTADLADKSWKEFHEFLWQPHAGLHITKVLIDEGGGHEGRTAIVRLFCEKFPEFIVQSVKGESLSGRRSGVKIFTRTKIEGQSSPTIMLNVDAIKDMVYNYLNRGTADGLPPREPFAGYCHFPIDYDDDHYKQLSSEERFIDRTRGGDKIIRWRQIYIRNHVLDCRVYALGALFVLFDDARTDWQSKNGKDIKYDWADFWNEAKEFHIRLTGQLPE